MFEIRISRVLSLLTVAGCVAVIISHEHAHRNEAIGACSLYLIPLILIWFPEETGDATGYFMGCMQVNTQTPRVLVSIFGWVILLACSWLFYAWFWN
jgi:hypothetical protein